MMHTIRDDIIANTTTLRADITALNERSAWVLALAHSGLELSKLTKFRNVPILDSQLLSGSSLRKSGLPSDPGT
jgi:hypothetical protein